MITSRNSIKKHSRTIGVLLLLVAGPSLIVLGNYQVFTLCIPFWLMRNPSGDPSTCTIDSSFNGTMETIGFFMALAGLILMLSFLLERLSPKISTIKKMIQTES